MVDVKIVAQSAHDYKGDNDIFAYEVSDDSLERVSNDRHRSPVLLARPTDHRGK
jgi:hypothetical protein